MKPRISLILLLCLFMKECTSSLSQADVYDIARLVCVGQNICSANNSEIDTIKEQSVCCSDCACEPSCKEFDNCCFQEHSYPVGNVGVNNEYVRSVVENDMEIVSECLYSSWPQPNDTIGKIRQQSFWMISEIVNSHKLSENQPCGQRNVAPWGSLLPVSSKKTGQIYKNIFCAKDHGVKEGDIVVWEGSISCGESWRQSIHLGEEYLDTCQKQFYVSTGIVIKRSSFCFKSIDDICPEENISIPRSAEMSRSNVIDACNSGILSQYILDDMFADIFCHICIGNGQIRTCPDLLFQSNEISGESISGLIDNNYLQSLSRAQDSRSDPFKERKACIEKDTVFGPVADICKIIRCPIGQKRNSEGKCFVLTPKWFNIIFKVSVQLVSANPLNIHEYFQDLPITRTDDISKFESPFPNSFKIDTIFYKPSMSLNDADEFLISLTKPTTITKTSLLMNAVKKSITQKWLLRSNNTSHTLNAQITSPLPYNKKVFTSRKNISYQRIYSDTLHQPVANRSF